MINKLTFKLIWQIEWGNQVRELTNSKKDGRPFLLGSTIRASDLLKIPRPTELKRAQLSKLN